MYKADCRKKKIESELVLHHNTATMSFFYLIRKDTYTRLNKRMSWLRCKVSMKRSGSGYLSRTIGTRNRTKADAERDMQDGVEFDHSVRRTVAALSICDLALSR